MLFNRIKDTKTKLYHSKEKIQKYPFTVISWWLAKAKQFRFDDENEEILKPTPDEYEFLN